MEQRVRVAAGRVRLAADLAIPAAAKGVVLFAHGSGSGRLSPRNRLVAAKLQQAGLATLLLDLLTGEEETAERAGGRLRFDVQLLAGRLAAALDWLATERRTVGLPVGLLGQAPAPGRRCWWLPTGRPRWRRWSPVAGDPTWLGPSSVGCGRPRCWWSAAATGPCWRSTGPPWRGWLAGPGWRLCPAPATCSRSQVPWSASPSWPSPGSWRTWPENSPPSRQPPGPSRSPAQKVHRTLCVRTAHAAHHNTSVRVSGGSPPC
jgi:hypothetical protein